MPSKATAPSRAAPAVLLVELGELGGVRRLVDLHLGLEVVAAGEVVPQAHRVPAALAAGLGDGGVVVDRQARAGRVDRDLLAVDGGGDRPVHPVGQPCLQALRGLALRVPADAYAGHGGAARHLVARDVVRGDVEPAEQDHEAEQQPHDDRGASLVAGLAVGTLLVLRHAASLGRRAPNPVILGAVRGAPATRTRPSRGRRGAGPPSRRGRTSRRCRRRSGSRPPGAPAPRVRRGPHHPRAKARRTTPGGSQASTTRPATSARASPHHRWCSSVPAAPETTPTRSAAGTAASVLTDLRRGRPRSRRRRSGRGCP